MNEKQYIETDGSETKYYSNRGMTELHREGAPAVEDTDGYKEWWIDGESVNEEEFDARMNPVELTLQEIAEKFGVSVDKLKIKK
jgi:hypothetical protein